MVLSEKKETEFERILKWFKEAIETEDYERFESKLKELMAQREERHYLIIGLGLGVTLGILGNFLASHWIEVLRGIVADDSWWITNVVAFAVAFVSVLTFVLWLVRQKQVTEAHQKFYAEVLKIKDKYEQKKKPKSSH